jgi:hypothetical protein
VSGLVERPERQQSVQFAGTCCKQFQFQFYFPPAISIFPTPSHFTDHSAVHLVIPASSSLTARPPRPTSARTNLTPIASTTSNYLSHNKTLMIIKPAHMTSSTKLPHDTPQFSTPPRPPPPPATSTPSPPNSQPSCQTTWTRRRPYGLDCLLEHTNPLIPPPTSHGSRKNSR